MLIDYVPIPDRKKNAPINSQQSCCLNKTSVSALAVIQMERGKFYMAPPLNEELQISMFAEERRTSAR